MSSQLLLTTISQGKKTLICSQTRSYTLHQKKITFCQLCFYAVISALLKHLSSPTPSNSAHNPSPKPPQTPDPRTHHLPPTPQISPNPAHVDLSTSCRRLLPPAPTQTSTGPCLAWCSSTCIRSFRGRGQGCGGPGRRGRCLVRGGRGRWFRRRQRRGRKRGRGTVRCQCWCLLVLVMVVVVVARHLLLLLVVV